MFLVNTETDGNQNSPFVAAFDFGKFVVIWDDNYLSEVFGQIFDVKGNRIGEQFRVTPSEGDLEGSYDTKWYNKSVMGAFPDGKFVVVLEAYRDD